MQYGPTQIQTPLEAARLIMRKALDEWRADCIANGVLSHTVIVGDESNKRGAGGPDVGVGGHVGQLGAILDSIVHPGWPDTVRAYRGGEIDLKTMWNTLLTQAEKIFIFLGYANAEVEHYKLESPFVGEMAAHSGATLYLAPVWSELSAAVKEHGVLAARDAFWDSETRILERAADALIAMWGRLGLTFETGSDDLFVIRVRDLQR